MLATVLEPRTAHRLRPQSVLASVDSHSPLRHADGVGEVINTIC